MGDEIRRRARAEDGETIGILFEGFECLGSYMILIACKRDLYVSAKTPQDRGTV